MTTQNEQYVSLLHDAVRDTFETVAFSEVTDWKISRNGTGNMSNCIASGVLLRKPVHGRFALYLDRIQCRELVETVYGPEILEQGDGEEICADFLNELVNTVAGRFVVALSSGVGEMELGLPAPIPEGTVEAGPGDGGIIAVFSLEGVPAACLLETE